MFSEVLKYNPYHDARGRFTSRGGTSRGVPSFAKDDKAKIAGFFKREYGIEVVWYKDKFNAKESPESDAKFRGDLEVAHNALKGLPKGTLQSIAKAAPSFENLRLPKDVDGIAYYDMKRFGIDSSVTQKFDPRWSVITRMAVVSQEESKKALFLHELGHMLTPKRSSVYAGVSKIESAFSSREDFKAWTARNVSKYATKNAHEFAAESFALYHVRWNGMSAEARRKYPKEWIDWVGGL